jgi:urea carboxylase-associated protein 2
MALSPDIQTAIAARRDDYEALKRAGQEHVPGALPPPSARGFTVDEAAVLHRETIPGGWYWPASLRRGEALLVSLEAGPAAVALVAWRMQDSSERLNYADSVKVQWTAALGRGRVLFSDMGRVMLSITEDSCGAHDALAGGSTAESNRQRYGEHSPPLRNTRENLILAAAKHGLGRRDVPPCISFFAPVGTDDEGQLVWHADRRQRGDLVVLRAEMDLLLALSNCPHPLDPDPDYAPPPVSAVRFRAAPATPNDACWTASAEAARGFENTMALVA